MNNRQILWGARRTNMSQMLLVIFLTGAFIGSLVYGTLVEGKEYTIWVWLLGSLIWPCIAYTANLQVLLLNNPKPVPPPPKGTSF